MADHPSVEVEILVDAPPEVVWALASDVTRIGEWSPECRGAEWVDGATAPAAGARFLGRQRRGESEWETVSTVTEAEPSRSFAWAVNDPEVPAATWRFDLYPEAGGTRVVQRAVMGPGPSGLTARIDRHPDREEDIVAARLEEHRRNMTATVEGLKRAAEGAG